MSHTSFSMQITDMLLNWNSGDIRSVCANCMVYGWVFIWNFCKPQQFGATTSQSFFDN